jgi:filamentous hemagglutinin family protein
MFILASLNFTWGDLSYAQGTPPITSSGLSTQISAPINNSGGQIQYNITGGTRPANGLNLFHSFGQFGLPSNNIANFLNETATPTSNILGRVTGGNPSNIFGTIQTTGFGGANLFLMNPAGIVFGPNASLNVGGSVSFTTADYLRLADGAQFHAIPGPQDASISSAPVTAFGFLGSNPSAIVVQGSQLSVPPGQNISLVGGNIEVAPGTLETGTPQPGLISAPGGQINFASVASAGEILYSGLQSAPNINGQSFTNMGSINLSGGSTLDVSANAAGMIKIRGGQLVMADATLAADTVNGNGASPAIDVNVTGNLSVSDTRGVPAITARTTGDGNSGDVQLTSRNADITSTSDAIFFAAIDTHTSGNGRGGNVSIATTDNLTVTGNPFGLMFFIDSGTIAPGAGNGGDVAISAGKVRLEETNINTGDLIARNLFSEAQGSGGNLTITADTFEMNHSTLATDGFFAGTAGNLTLNASQINLSNFSQLSLISLSGGGALNIKTEKLTADSSQFELETATAPGGGVNIEARSIELKNGTTMRSQTAGNGKAGDITIVATDHLTLSDDPTTLGALIRPTGIFTNSEGNADLGNQGNAGSILITTPRLEINGGARIDATTNAAGRGGNISITAFNAVALSGERPTDVVENELFGLGSTRPSGIFSRTVGSELCGARCGDAGGIILNTGDLSISGGAQINSGSNNSGNGGHVQINAGRVVSISEGTDIDTSGIFSRTVQAAPGAGLGGDITINAGQSVSLSSRSAISASSTGPANAGNVVINAGSQFLSQNGSVTTQASQASGGNITIQATDSIRLVNSQLSTSVQGGPNTAGGNITLDPAVVTLQNSQVTAQAFQGQGGNINIIAGTFLADQSSVVSASSQFGLSGTVNIQSPLSNLSGTLATLAQRPLQAQPLLTQRCAAQLNGQLSSLVIAGRDSLPTEPGGWLMSPLALMAGDEPAPQAYLTTDQGLEASQQGLEPWRLLPDHHNLSLQRGVWDRETGCGS